MIRIVKSGALEHYREGIHDITVNCFDVSDTFTIPDEQTCIIHKGKIYEVPKAHLSCPTGNTYITGHLGAIEFLQELTL